MPKVKKTEWLIIRVSVFEKDKVQKDAKAKGLHISKYIRRKLGFRW